MIMLYFTIQLVVVIFGTIYFKISGIRVFALSFLPTTLVSFYILFDSIIVEGFRAGLLMIIFAMPLIIYFYLFPILLFISFLTLLIEKKIQVKLHLLILINYSIIIVFCLLFDSLYFDKKCFYIALFMPISLYVIKFIEKKRNYV